MKEKPKIDQGTVMHMIDVARKLNYGIQLKFKDGTTTVRSTTEIAHVTRDGIFLIVEFGKLPPEGIAYGSIDSVAAVALGKQSK